MSDKIIPFAGLPEKHQATGGLGHNEMLLARIRGVPMQTGPMRPEDAVQNPNAEDKDALIERLQKELKEAREMVAFQEKEMADTLGIIFTDGAGKIIRAKTIEECANLADKFANERWTADRAFYGKEVCIELAKAIRSIDGGGK